MNKKLIKILLFIFTLTLIILVYLECSKSTVEDIGPNCRVDGYPYFSCSLGWVMDEDEDGNVSLNVTLFNNFDYAINDFEIIFDKCSYTKHVESVGSKGELNIQTPDTCEYHNFGSSYDNYHGSISTSFKIKIKILEYKGEISSSVFDITKEEYLLGREQERESKKAYGYKIQTKFIFLGSIIFICFIVWQLRKKRDFSFKNLITAVVPSFFLSIILAGFVYISFIFLLFPVKYTDVPSYNEYLISIFTDIYILLFVFLVSFVSIAVWLYKNYFTNKVIIRKAILFLAAESFIFAIISFLSNYVILRIYSYRPEKRYILFGLILGIITFAIGKFLLKNDRLGKEIKK